MLRYLKGVQMIKKIIEDNDLQVMATIARYACAYEAIAKQDWWDKSKRYCSCLLVAVMYFPLNVILSVVAPSSSRAPTFATCRVTLVEMWTSPLSAPTHSSGMRIRAT
jgi:hypothetical protein